MIYRIYVFVYAHIHLPVYIYTHAYMLFMFSRFGNLFNNLLVFPEGFLVYKN